MPQKIKWWWRKRTSSAKRRGPCSHKGGLLLGPCRLCYSAGNKHRQGQQQSLQEGHWGAEDPGMPRNFALACVQGVCLLPNFVS